MRVGELGGFRFQFAGKQAFFVAGTENVLKARPHIFGLRAAESVVAAVHRFGMDALKKEGRAALFLGIALGRSAEGNVANPKYPELEDFGECSLVADNGSTGYFRVDWLTPDGLGSWGDGRLIILGTEGYIELRKYIDIATSNGGEQLLLVDAKGEHRIPCGGNVGFPFFGELILDCLQGTEKAMTQRHTFLAAELCLKAQKAALRLNRPPV